MVIYKITNLINDKIYIGQTIQNYPKNRFNQHCRKTNSISLINYAIKKYGKENFLFEIIEECENMEILNNREVYWIKKLNSMNRNLGYNLMTGGNNSRHSEESKKKMSQNSRPSEETKRKISLANKGRKLSNETKMRMSKTHSGKKHSEETKSKIGSKHKGKKLSIETKIKIGLVNKGRKHSDEAKRKISLSSKGNTYRLGTKHSNKTKMKMSLMRQGENNSMYDRKHTDETKQKLREIQIGRKYSEETKLKMAEAHSKEYKITFLNGTNKTIKNLRKFCRENNLNYSCMCLVAQGKRNHHQNFKVICLENVNE